MNGYDLSRNWFNFSFENPEKVRPIHAAIFFFACEHCNRLGGKDKFGFPSQMTMDAIGVKNYQTYGRALKDLEDWGFIIFVERSRNQYSANIISISAPTKNGIARGKALDKATLKHVSKQTRSTVYSTVYSTVSIDKPLTNKPSNQETKECRENSFREQVAQHTQYNPKMLEAFSDYWTESKPKGKKLKFEMQRTFDIKRRLKTWSKNDTKFGTTDKLSPIEQATHNINTGANAWLNDVDFSKLR